MSAKKPKVARLNLKPTNLTTGFGTASYDPRSGNVGYQLDDGLSQLRDYFYSQANEQAPTEDYQAYVDQLGLTGQDFVNRGLNTDTNQETQDYYNRQSQLMAPNRAQEESRQADTLFRSGRMGAAVGRGDGYVNPERFELLKSREEADAQRMFAAEDRAYNLQGQDIQRGMGLIDSSNALNMMPYNNMGSLFNMGAGIENLGMGMLNPLSGFSQSQMGADTAMQANQQARNNAKASGSFGSSLMNAAIGGAQGYLTGGLSGAAMGGLSGLSGGGGGFGSLFGGGMQLPGYAGGMFDVNSGTWGKLTDYGRSKGLWDSTLGTQAYQNGMNWY